MIKGQHAKRLGDLLQIVYTKCRFVAYFFMNCEIVPTDDIPTMAISTSHGKVHLWYNELFVSTLSDEEVTAVLAHEFMHVLNGHTRSKIRNQLSNIAQDMVINEYIEENKSKFFANIKIDLPTNCLLLPDPLKPKKGELTWLEVYEWLKKQKQNQPKIINKKETDEGSFNVNSKIKVDCFNNKDVIFDSESGVWKIYITKGTIEGTTDEVICGIRITNEKYEKADKKNKVMKFEQIQVTKNCVGVSDSAEIIDITKAIEILKKKKFQYETTGAVIPAENDICLVYGLINDEKRVTSIGIFKPNPLGGDGGDGDNSGKGEKDGDEGGGKGDGSDEKNSIDSHEKWKDSDDTEIDRILDRAVTAAKDAPPGDTSGSLIEVLKKIRKKKINFGGKLKGIVDFLSSDDRNYSWRRLDRRLLSEDIIEKGLNRYQREKITVAVDTSGSIQTSDLENAFGVIEDLTKKYGINLIEIDTEIKQTCKYEKGDWKKIKIKGRGGTHFNVLFNEYLKGHKETVIMITDGQVELASLKPYERTLWLVNDKNFKKPFGKFIYLESNEQ